MENLARALNFIYLDFGLGASLTTFPCYWVHYVPSGRLSPGKLLLNSNTSIWNIASEIQKRVSVMCHNGMKKCLKNVRSIGLCFEAGFFQVNEHTVGIDLMVLRVYLISSLRVQFSIIKKIASSGLSSPYEIQFLSEVWMWFLLVLGLNLPDEITYLQYLLQLVSLVVVHLFLSSEWEFCDLGLLSAQPLKTFWSGWGCRFFSSLW